jgi:hypothetical protein
MEQCNCCYCQTKGKPGNPEYLRGLQFAVDFVQGEWQRLKEGVDRNRKHNREGKITDRMLRSNVQNLESQMRYLGEWHDILAKEGNKELKLIKDIDWKEYLYGDY